MKRWLLAVFLLCAPLTAASEEMLLMGVGGGAGTGPAGCTAATTALAALSGLSAGQITAYTTMICGMVADGTWATFDGFYYLASTSQANGVVNLANPGTHNLTVNGTCTFTAKGGITGDGSTCYLDTGLALTAATHYALNSAHIGFCIFTNANNTGTLVESGVADASNIDYIAVNQGNVFFGGLNNAGFPSTATASSNVQGTWVVTRGTSGSTTISYFNNGSSLGTSSTASTAVITVQTLVFMAYNSAGTKTDFIPFQMGYAFFGSGLTSAQVSSIESRLSAMNAAIGTPAGC